MKFSNNDSKEFMRIITWNCGRGKFDDSLSRLQDLAPDIAILQECGKPDASNNKQYWFGERVDQGIAVVVFNGYKLNTHPHRDNALKFMLPFEVVGPIPFNLFAVWTKRQTGKNFRKEDQYYYVDSLWRNLDVYEDLIRGNHSVIVGDFNSNPCFGSPYNTKRLNHSMIVDKLKKHFHLNSCYHSYYGVAHGNEKHHSFFMHRNAGKPYHIDYCFIPDQWTSQIKHVELPDYSFWKDHSDHVPLVIDMEI